MAERTVLLVKVFVLVTTVLKFVDTNDPDALKLITKPQSVVLKQKFADLHGM